MNGIANYIVEGGSGMYLVACLGMLGLVFGLGALASLFSSSRKFPIGMGLAAIVIGLMTLGMGLLAMMFARHSVDEVLPLVDPSMADALRARGYEEADNSLVFGGLACVAPLLAGMIAVGRGALMKTPKS